MVIINLLCMTTVLLLLFFSVCSIFQSGEESTAVDEMLVVPYTEVPSGMETV